MKCDNNIIKVTKYFDNVVRSSKNNINEKKNLNNKYRLLGHSKLLFEVQYFTLGPTAFQPL